MLGLHCECQRQDKLEIIARLTGWFWYYLTVGEILPV